MRVLIIGKIWPEPTSSAAGVRALDLIRACRHADWETHFACAAQRNELSADLARRYACQEHAVALNDAAFEDWIRSLEPDIVVFDRFMTEEQFGWRVEKAVPHALRALDTSDLHFLREARRQSLNSDQTLDLQNDTARREIAALFRCDLTLVISEFERQLLRDEFALPTELVAYWPFCLPQPLPNPPAFEQRSGFVAIGNFLHEPNWDAVRFCRQAIWPEIRAALPDASIDVYGAYTPPKARQLHDPKIGFRICGRADDAVATLSAYRVNLAPLRFGAGLKGKLADAFLAGTPSVATPIAAEAMAGDLPWGSEISATPATFARTAIELHQSHAAWRDAQQAGYAIARRRFSETEWLPRLPEILESAYREREQRRRRNFVGQLLRHHHQRSTEFMSRWIEEKNRRNKPPTP